MLRPICRSFPRFIRSSRAFTSNSNSDDNGDSDTKPKINAKDAIDASLVNAAAEAAKALHPADKPEQKKSLKALIGRLKETSIESYKESQKGILSEIVDTIKDVKVEKPTKASVSEVQLKRAKIAIRHEVFEEALMRGFSELEARNLATKATEYAEDRMKNPTQVDTKLKEVKSSMSEMFTEERAMKPEYEKKIENLCQMAMKIYDKTFAEPGYNIWSGVASRRPVVSDSSAKSLFDVFADTPDLKIFTNPKLKKHDLEFWKQYDLERAKIVGEGFGPQNAFDEIIEWTEKGMLWPYPINNELELGEELNVPFYEHVFLESYMEKYNLPKAGPIAQFMELVCVGLSKNPFMTAEKKRNHLDWFGHYFHQEQVDKVHGLHEKEKAMLEVETS